MLLFKSVISIIDVMWGDEMAREKYQTLTEQMFYILICLTKESCGVDIMKEVADLTDGRVVIGPGTLYSLLDKFVKENIIFETGMENRKKNYMITDLGRKMLDKEYLRIAKLKNDYENLAMGGVEQ